MNNNLKYISFEIICFGICLLNLFYNIIPQLILYIIIITSAIKRLNKYAMAFFCLLFLKDVNHAMFFFNYNISLMAYITIIIAIVIMFKFLLRNKKAILEKGKYLWLIMLFFLLSMIIKDNISCNFKKFVDLLITGIFSYIAYVYLFYYRSKIDFFRLALYCAIFAMFLLQLNTITNHYGTPSSIVDFGFYRSKVGADMYVDLAETGVKYATHYQFFGTMCTIGITLCMAFCRLSLKQVITLFIFNLLSIGYTGARQYLIIMFILFAIYILKMKGNIIGKLLFIFGCIFILSFIIFQSVMSDYVNVISERGLLEGTGRESLFETGIDLFKSNPLFGVGFGGYHYYGQYSAYPHNIIVELLAEVGIFGLIVVLFCVFINKAGLSLLYNRKYDIYLMYVVLAFLMRSMISLSLSGNIMLFSILSAMTYLSYILRREQINITIK